MPRLYCETHGREDEAATTQRQEHYHQEGESVLIVSGKLRSGPWLCDRCNETIGRGSVAYLTSAFPRWITEQMHGYDFADERRYFGGRYDRIAVYGADWPDLRVGAGAGPMPPRRPGHRQQRPLCALDLRAERAAPPD